MKRILIAVLLCLPMPLVARAQPLTLDQALTEAYAYLQFDDATRTYHDAAALAEKNAGKTWLPRITLDGSFSHQNENVSIPVDLPVPGFTPPSSPLSFTRLLLNFSQTIYDGSLAANRKKLARASYAIREKELEVEKVGIKSQVLSLYMSILLADERLAILDNRRRVLAERHTVLSQAERFGGAATVDVKTLAAELLLVEQNLIEARHARATVLGSLGELMGRDLPADQALVRPAPQVVLADDVSARPELQLVDLQIAHLDIQRSLLDTSRRPRLSAFGTVGGGVPGYDIFRDEVSFMGQIGVSLQWQVLDWSQAHNEKRILAADQALADFQRRRLQTRLLSELKTYGREIGQFAALLDKDDDLVVLRAEVSDIKAAQLENGTITSTDYITETNLEDEARLNQKIHELRLVLARLNYLTLQGK